MTFKSIMLGAAALATAATTATTVSAADLPVAVEPVDYVMICDAYGARFYYIPGTETCLRVGGRVRTQFIVEDLADEGNWADRDEEGYSWRTQGYLYLDARTATEYGDLRAYIELSQRAQNGAETFDFGSTYIQWGGLTAGYLGSNFDIFTGQTFMGVVGRNWSDSTLNQIAYTATFGDGFSATVAIEDRSGREVGTYGGTRAPDFVGALGVSQGWGSAQLSGALHQIYRPGDAAGGDSSEDELGWAVGAGVKFNLPMITSGSNIYFQGFYADGALSYIGSAGAYTVRTGGTSTTVTVTDYSGADSTSTGYSLSSGIYIQATSTIGLALDGSYMDIDQKDTFDIERWAVDGSIQWEPVSGFIMGVDAGYANVDAGRAGDDDDFLIGVRAQRTF